MFIETRIPSIVGLSNQSVEWVSCTAKHVLRSQPKLGQQINPEEPAAATSCWLGTRNRCTMETSMASYKVEVGGNQVPTNSCTACQGQKEKPLALPQTFAVIQTSLQSAIPCERVLICQELLCVAPHPQKPYVLSGCAPNLSTFEKSRT